MSSFYTLWEKMQNESLEDYMGSVFDTLKRYPDNVYVHFTKGVSNKSGTSDKILQQPKIGMKIGMQSHCDPIAIYAFPKQYVLSPQFSDNSHFYRMEYIYIIQPKSGQNILNLSKMTEIQGYNLSQQMGLEDEWLSTRSDGNGRIPGSAFYEMLKQIFKKRGLNKNFIYNQYLRKAGIDALLDNGSGIFHQNEKYQIAFINPNGYQILDLIENPIARGISHKKIAYKIINTIASEILGKYTISSNKHYHQFNVYANGQYKNKPINIYLYYYYEGTGSTFHAKVGLSSHYLTNNLPSFDITVPHGKEFDVNKECKLIAIAMQNELEKSSLRPSKKRIVANFSNKIAKILGYTKMPALDEETATLTRHYKKGKFRFNFRYSAINKEYNLSVLIETKGLYSAVIDGKINIPEDEIKDPKVLAEPYLEKALDDLKERIYMLYNPNRETHGDKMYAFDYAEKGRQLLDFLEFIKNKFAITVS